MMLVIAIITCGLAGGTGAAPLSPALTCEAAKLTAAQKKEQCLIAERVKEVKGRVPDYVKCGETFTAAIAKAEAKAGPGVCPSEGDADAVEALIDTFFADLSAALSGTPNPLCVPAVPGPQRAFPATGQTTCWNNAGVVIPCPGTGQDGDFQAGATLSYTDNGDGTITDNNTGLMWEKKSDDGSIHDQHNVYTWDNAVAQHIAALNTAPCFAGHCDWRLPNVKELQSIVNYQSVIPAVSSAFNTACAANCTVLTCSCTFQSFHWSSTTHAFVPTVAWIVDFSFGALGANAKGSNFSVRAVREGL
jgi:hypothetical protein